MQGGVYTYIAHKREDDSQQLLLQHLLSTANYASSFAKSFNNEEYAYMIGLLHDLGKYSKTFQNRILNNGNKCDHSTAGAIITYEQMKPFGVICSYCIAGHHSGLQNYGSIIDEPHEGTLMSRMNSKSNIPDYSSYESEIKLNNYKMLGMPNIKPLGKGGYSVSFLIRMLYSALVDADFLDTEKFMNDGKVDRSITYDFPGYHKKLHSEINRFNSDGIINIKRHEILKNCIKKSVLDRGLFSLTVPTGGGKTISSMAFAIKHLLKHKMDRIIYVIPYTSIIEQNAKVFKNIFGENSVLEHHSNFDFEHSEHSIDNQHNKLYLATENWDAPIIVTTNVQFFESLYGNRSSKCRKLHNIANSVIIFDEVQMLPEEYLTPCIMGIAELVANCNATAVLCSATQPTLMKQFPKEIKSVEIQEDIEELYQVFNRTQIVNRNQMDSTAIAEEMNALKQCLCIVNTRKHALKIYEYLEGDDKYHLSTLMCPSHRKDVVDEIRRRLREGSPCRVVSTRLIEAGVDVDFPRVYRMIAGVDSIVQAAGRCNREGKLKNSEGEWIKGEVHVFEAESEYTKRQPHSFLRPIEVTKKIMRQFEDISTPEAISEYFKNLYTYTGSDGLDIKNIFKRLESNSSEMAFDFKTIADDFRLIQDNSIAIIIPYNDQARKWIEEVKYIEYPSKLLRALQPYTVSIYENEYEALVGSGKIQMIREGVNVLSSKDDYSEDTGLIITFERGVGIYI
ncbi:MAG: CRISPR-associated helicase Cas3' [Vallitaleaceae bacterium]|nr:CRISPR-associated helicase Cas3' [Vallitaleaceae bacterium]